MVCADSFCVPGDFFFFFFETHGLAAVVDFHSRSPCLERGELFSVNKSQGFPGIFF